MRGVVAGIMEVVSPPGGGRSGMRTRVARIPKAQPRAIRILSFLVSRESPSSRIFL